MPYQRVTVFPLRPGADPAALRGLATRFSAIMVALEGCPPWARVPLGGAKLEEERRNFYVALTRSCGSVLLQLSPSGLDARKDTIQRGYSSFALDLAASLGELIGPAPATP